MYVVYTFHFLDHIEPMLQIIKKSGDYLDVKYDLSKSIIVETSKLDNYPDSPAIAAIKAKKGFKSKYCAAIWRITPVKPLPKSAPMKIKHLVLQSEHIMESGYVPMYYRQNLAMTDRIIVDYFMDALPVRNKLFPRLQLLDLIAKFRPYLDASPTSRQLTPEISILINSIASKFRMSKTDVEKHVLNRIFMCREAGDKKYMEALVDIASPIEKFASHF